MTLKTLSKPIRQRPRMQGARQMLTTDRLAAPIQHGQAAKLNWPCFDMATVLTNNELVCCQQVGL